MTMIADTTQPDLRQHPGDGARTKVKHIVRIIVVPNVKSAPSDGRHELTQEELDMGEVHLKKTPAPASQTPLPKGPQRTMFDDLKPTDIVVIGGEAASVLVDADNGANGAPPTRRLVAHDDRHRDTVLRVWTDSDTIEYQSDVEFQIVEMKRAGWHIYGSPENPFEHAKGSAPYFATNQTDPALVAPGQPTPAWTWTSGEVPASANNQQYKMTFRIAGQLVDPDVVCGDPPPSAR
jgi:hypothetical protein